MCVYIRYLVLITLHLLRYYCCHTCVIVYEGIVLCIDCPDLLLEVKHHAGEEDLRSVVSEQLYNVM